MDVLKHPRKTKLTDCMRAPSFPLPCADSAKAPFSRRSELDFWRLTKDWFGPLKLSDACRLIEGIIIDSGTTPDGDILLWCLNTCLFRPSNVFSERRHASFAPQVARPTPVEKIRRAPVGLRCRSPSARQRHTSALGPYNSCSASSRNLESHEADLLY